MGILGNRKLEAELIGESCPREEESLINPCMPGGSWSSSVRGGLGMGAVGPAAGHSPSTVWE